MRDESGEWSGISISLWEALAEELDLAYRFEEASLADMIDGVADGRFDASVAATTITPSREREVDFTHPFYTTGFGIVTARERGGWLGIVAGLFSLEFLGAVGLLVLVLGIIGFFFWISERRHNPEEFRPDPQRGLGDGFWFAAVTMTTVGYGDKAPRTAAGRMVALVWMFTAILITSTFTGLIASSLTARRLDAVIETPSDLADVATGSVAGSASEGWLEGRGLSFEPFESVADGLEAVERGAIVAFVYDKPLLDYLVARSHADTLGLVPGTFGRQDYGIALPPDSPLRETLNRALLRQLDSAEWDALLRRYLGQRD